MNNISSIINNLTYKTRTDGRIEARITIAGKRKSFYGSTKVEIKNKAKEYLSKIENGYVEPKKITLNEYMEYWLNTYKKNKIEPSSYSRLYSVYKHQIMNGIGKRKIGDITRQDIQNMIDSHANPTGNQKALAKSGLKKIMHLLNPCFSRAVSDGVISSNPCDDVQIPVDSCIKTDTKKQFSLDDTQIEQLKSKALSKYSNGQYQSRDALVLLIILNTGMRVGEMLALKWSDINENGIRIDKTVQSNIIDYSEEETKIYSLDKKSAKTSNGVRMIAINESLEFLLSELKKYDTEKKIKSEYVACTRTSTRNSARNLQRSLDRLTKDVQCKDHITLHTLRHTFGSVLLRRGVNIEVVSKLMGHSNITITYNKYIHTIQEQQVKAMQMINIC